MSSPCRQEADGSFADTTALYSISTRVPIHVAQRYSIVLESNQSTSTNYWLRNAMVTSCFSDDNNVLDPTTKAVISYSGNHTLAPSDASLDWADAQPVHCIDLDDSLLTPILAKPPPGATKMWRVDFSFGIGAYQLDRAKVNGTTWSPLANTTTLIKAVDGLKGETATGVASTNTSTSTSTWAVEGTVGSFGSNQFVVGVSNEGGSQVDVVDILVYSLDEGSHPFHLHGHTFVRSPYFLSLAYPTRLPQQVFY